MTDFVDKTITFDTLISEESDIEDGETLIVSSELVS